MKLINRDSSIQTNTLIVSQSKYKKKMIQDIVKVRNFTFTNYFEHESGNKEEF